MSHLYLFFDVAKLRQKNLTTKHFNNNLNGFSDITQHFMNFIA